MFFIELLLWTSAWAPRHSVLLQKRRVLCSMTEKSQLKLSVVALMSIGKRLMSVPRATGMRSELQFTTTHRLSKKSLTHLPRRPASCHRPPKYVSVSHGDCLSTKLISQA